MKLEIKNCIYIETPSITQCPPECGVLASSMQYFDKDGYELNHTEQLYHEKGKPVPFLINLLPLMLEMPALLHDLSLPYSPSKKKENIG